MLCCAALYCAALRCTARHSNKIWESGVRHSPMIAHQVLLELRRGHVLAVSVVVVHQHAAQPRVILRHYALCSHRSVLWVVGGIRPLRKYYNVGGFPLAYTLHSNLHRLNSLIHPSLYPSLRPSQVLQGILMRNLTGSSLRTASRSTGGFKLCALPQSNLSSPCRCTPIPKTSL